WISQVLLAKEDWGHIKRVLSDGGEPSLYHLDRKPMFRSNDSHPRPPLKLQMSSLDSRKIVVRNPLTAAREELVRVQVDSPNVLVRSPLGEVVPHQLNPLWQEGQDGKMAVQDDAFELLFLASLPPLSLMVYSMESRSELPAESDLSTIYSSSAVSGSSHFLHKPLPRGNDVQIENARVRLQVDGRTGQLQHLEDKETGRRHVLRMTLGHYPTEPHETGSYLMKVVSHDPSALLGIPLGTELHRPEVVIISGPLETELAVMLKGKSIVYSWKVLHAGSEATRESPRARRPTGLCAG
ncbi:unnamed protein product, partial [Cyprideis torosa]